VAAKLNCPLRRKVRMSPVNHPHDDQRPIMRLVGVASLIGRGWGGTLRLSL